jgi:O-antigen ligase
MDSALFSRLQELFQPDSEQERKSMYKVAFQLFERNPVFGIGYDQFKLISGFNTFSHSTYAEALSCTGAVGVILYFIPYIIVFIKLVKKVRMLRNGPDGHYAYIWMAMFFTMIFLATGMIHYYDIGSNIILGMMITFANMDFQRPQTKPNYTGYTGEHIKNLSYKSNC